MWDRVGNQNIGFLMARLNYVFVSTDPIPGHYLESPLDRETDVKRGEYERVYTATVDPDVAKMENLMDQWCLDLKRNVLVSTMNF